MSLTAGWNTIFAYRFVQYTESTLQVWVQNILDVECTGVAVLLFMIVTHVHTYISVNAYIQT